MSARAVRLARRIDESLEVPHLRSTCPAVTSRLKVAAALECLDFVDTWSGYNPTYVGPQKSLDSATHALLCAQEYLHQTGKAIGASCLAKNTQSIVALRSALSTKNGLLSDGSLLTVELLTNFESTTQFHLGLVPGVHGQQVFSHMHGLHICTRCDDDHTSRIELTTWHGTCHEVCKTIALLRLGS